MCEKLTIEEIHFEHEPKLKICSHDSGKLLGWYQPDFLIDDKVLVEVKALPKITFSAKRQLYDYLRNSKYEVGLLVNFSLPSCKIIRLIHTGEYGENGTSGK